MSLEILPNGTPLVCPVCGKNFKATDTTRFVIKGSYTCSWQCFKTQHIKDNKERWEQQRQIQLKIKKGEQKKRGRKKKDLKVDSAYNKFKSSLVTNSKETLEGK